MIASDVRTRVRTIVIFRLLAALKRASGGCVHTPPNPLTRARKQVVSELMSEAQWRRLTATGGRSRKLLFRQLYSGGTPDSLVIAVPEVWHGMVRGAANYALAHIIAQRFYAVSMSRRERDGRSGVEIVVGGE